MGKKKRLDIEYSFDFQAYGLISTLKAYRMAWEINRVLGSALVRKPDLEIEQKTASANFTHFANASEVSPLHLFRNRSADEQELRAMLVPEHPRFDYVLLARGEAFEDSNRLQELLRNIASIELVAFIPLAALKSKENFIF